MPELEVLYGRNAVRETLRAERRRVYRVLLAEGLAPSPVVAEIASLCKERHIPTQFVPRDQLEQVARSDSHQGVAAQVAGFPYSPWQEMLAEAGKRGEMALLLMLDSVQDPQNLGSLVRTAEALAAHGIILPKRRSVEVTPAVVNASAGSVEHMRVDQVSNLTQTMERLKQEGVWAVGLEDTPDAQPYTEADLARPLVLVVGGEGPGLGRLLRERCDFLIWLPMRGHVSSLNVAVAASVALYEVERQRAAMRP
jgi:23S rRNA (guanosine2251-2'-O)-methyltransferase